MGKLQQIISKLKILWNVTLSISEISSPFLIVLKSKATGQWWAVFAFKALCCLVAKVALLLWASYYISLCFSFLYVEGNDTSFSSRSAYAHWSDCEG